MSDIIDNLKEALNHSPNNIPLLLQIARMQMQAGEYGEAERYYKSVLENDQENFEGKLGLAKASFFLDKHSVAIVILEQLQDLNEDNTDLLVLLSKAYLKEGSIEKAIKVYQKALQLDSKCADDDLDTVLRHGVQDAPEEDFVDEDAIRILETPNINFEDVGGMEGVKREIELKIIQPLKHPELYEAYGKKIGGGILLYGPPGCGKTYLARATAGQINAKFINVGISDVLDMWIGNSEKNLKAIFETARRNKPCVLFFDEVDALGASRSDMRQSGGRHLINHFLSELDGLESDNEGLLILAATNTPWHLDPAFRRPGRFDRIIFVQPPDQMGLEEIVKLKTKGKPIKDIDYKKVAKHCAEFSGADVMAVVDIAIEEKLEQSFKTGIPEPLSTKDLVKAAKQHKASTREWFNSARNYALYANDSGLYDDILSYMNIKK
ncbi:MAG: ATP-binding protein [Bacteroidota bacterium]